jgi:hypothetical protein
MAWSKGAANKVGGGGGAGAAKGDGKAGNKGSKDAASQGKGKGSIPAAFNYQQLAAELLKQQEQKAKQDKGHKQKCWCCPCGFAENFMKREACFKCGLAKGNLPPPLPPGLAAGPPAVDKDGDQTMKAVVELSLEDKIRGIQGDIKWMKMSLIPETKAQVALYEAELQKLLDQQKKERPLPARLQAATARDEKAKAAQAEAIKKVASLEEQLRLAKVQLEESNQQAAAAAAELLAVKQTAGEDLAAVTAASMVAAVQQVLATVHDPRVVQEMIEAIRGLMAGPGALPPPPPPPQPPEAAAAAAAQELAQQQLQAAEAQAAAARAAATQAGVEAGQQLLGAMFRQQAAAAAAAAAAAQGAAAPAVGLQQPGGPPPPKTGRGRSPAHSDDSSGDGEGGPRSRSERKRQKKAAKQARQAAKAVGTQ